jgi:hypothetical protein
MGVATNLVIPGLRSGIPFAPIVMAASGVVKVRFGVSIPIK